MELRRLNLVDTHINGVSRSSALQDFESRGPGIDTKNLQQVYLRPLAELCLKLWHEMETQPTFDRRADFEQSRAEARQKTVERIFHIMSSLQLTEEQISQPLYRMIIAVSVSSFDLGLYIRLAVHLGAYIDTIKSLGTEKHQSLIKRALRMQDYGCLCMTEFGHGSNLQALETTAAYDHSTRSFILNSPTPSSPKFWIGALGSTANVAVVFAQLILGGKNYGLHVFAISIRNRDTHQPLPGLTIGDCGAKQGLNDVDNGFLIFENYVVPYDALLDKYTQISEFGKYKSPFEKPKARFGVIARVMAGLRVALVGTSEAMLRNGLTVAIKYAATRQQFNKRLLEYELHQYRLMPLLARLFATRAVFQDLCERNNAPHKDRKALHAAISIAKVLSSLYAADGIRECRQACGGHGYSAYSGFARWLCDQDVQLTWEGDNYVMMQQTSKILLTEFRFLFKGRKIISDDLNFINRFRDSFNPLQPSDLQDTSKLLTLLEYRVLNYLAQSTKRLGSADWNKVQVHFFNCVSVSYGELYFARCLVQFAQHFSDQKTQQCIRNLGLLFILACLEKDPYSIQQWVNSALFTELQAQIRRLCGQIAECAVTLVQAIAAPDNVLGSLLGRKEGLGPYLEQVETAPRCYDLPEWLERLKQIRSSF